MRSSRAATLARTGTHPEQVMDTPGIEEKINFLRRCEAYPDRTGSVATKETHMSWVFLTERYAYKLKKPVRHAFLDYSTIEARRRTCEEEVRLNRRLAGDVYCGIVPLTVADSEMRLGGGGEIVDWLVKMRRLPDARMLDHAIALKTVSKPDVRRIGVVLAEFYHDAARCDIRAAEYIRQIMDETCVNREELARPEYSLPLDLLDAATQAQLEFMARESRMLEQRVSAGRIVEAHGDLRPEHIFLGPPPVIIDCLEFSRSLRTLDAASELSFLWLECERLGASDVGRMIFESYRDASGDDPPPAIMAFYKSCHACVRAKVAVWHINDHAIDHPAKWIERARQYLQLAVTNLPARRASETADERGQPNQRPVLPRFLARPMQRNSRESHE